MLDGSRRVIRTWCPVELNERVAEGTHWLEFSAPEIAATSDPGQFVMVGYGASGPGVPFLPRPNSVASALDGRVGLFIRVFGAGSRKLAALSLGDEVLLLGPIGRGFELGEARRIICVAGGVGLAPFLLLPRWAATASPEAEIKILYGERQRSAVFDPDKIGEIAGVDAEIWTEDGSLGREGRVTAGMELDGVDLVLGCGPTPMLKEIQRLTIEAGVPCQLAVEEHMACGVGTCFGCTVGTVNPKTAERGYELACISGPVFSAERLWWPT